MDMDVDRKQLEQHIDLYTQRAISISISMQSIQKNISKDSSVTPDQFNLLNVINTTDHCTASFLAKALNVKKSSITAIVNRLTDKELIKREYNEKDKRVVWLELTEKGQHIVLEERQKILAVLMPLGNKLTVRELEELNQYLSVIDTQLNNIKKDMVKNEI
ncbi:MarR family winged helix-turn-helix transcriptional regulator [Paenibacillus sp. OK003]|uniref:MarR family winged helix-turn-helix transcriptional regulator n=1 Tax=Paenibacillus sp. OK003 TaxID=1884380 RepID=UPI0008CE43FA|nr:MarR family transcriptional regulator [Paenibacillus sp. OK003]SEK59788.1 transcriptional regulator, MarR family [Paenibacillus sp. OK003]